MVKVAFIGAGSVVFTRNLVNDILLYPELQDLEIHLMDIDPDRLNTSYGLVKRIIERQGAKTKVYKTSNQEEAIKDAKYVINSIQVGGLSATLRDFDVPEKYGIKQTIGDTHGIGGIFRALRTIPVVLELAHNMEMLSPKDAILINYSNPMAMVCWAVYADTTVNVVGLCHSIQGTARQIASYIGVDYERLRYRAGGINHLDWFLELELDGKDAYPLLREAMQNEEIYKKDGVRFEMMKMFDYFVSESSEHNAEYTPYFLKDEDSIVHFDIPIREYIRRCMAHDVRYEENKEIALGRKPLPAAQKTIEYAPRIIHAVETGKSATIHGNVKNTKLIPNLPEGCCVEIPVLINKNGLQPTYFGELPPQLCGLIRWHVSVQELVVKAVLQKRREFVYQAALLDPLVASSISPMKIREMVDEMLQDSIYRALFSE